VGSSMGYSITWSARSSSGCGIVSPSALAVLRLITSSNLVGYSTGKSPGLVPFKIFATCPPARRSTSEAPGPYDMRARLSSPGRS
jgi:hypothetical protein